MKSLNMRTHYHGEISGILLYIKTEEQRRQLISDLGKYIQDAAAEKKAADFRQGLWRATGLLVGTAGTKLVNCLLYLFKILEHKLEVLYAVGTEL